MLINGQLFQYHLCLFCFKVLLLCQVLSNSLQVFDSGISIIPFISFQFFYALQQIFSIVAYTTLVSLD